MNERLRGEPPLTTFRLRPLRRRSRSKKMTWSKGGFGSVMVASFTIQNDNDFSVKDLVIGCSLIGNSGTRIGSVTKTLYETVPKHSTKAFGDVNFGFVNEQARRAECEVHAASQ
jgi:hypothetical protein